MHQLHLLGHRLVARSIETQDCKAIYSYRRDSSANRYQGWKPKTEQEVVDKLCGSEEVLATSSDWSQLVLCTMDYAIVGDLGYSIDGRRWELGCTLAPQYHGYGYAKEGLALLIDYLRSEYERLTFVASVDPRNEAALSLLASLGFSHRSTSAKAFKIRDEWVDDAIYELATD